MPYRILIFSILLFSSCTTLIKYSEPNEPKFTSNKFTKPQLQFDSSLKVMCFNIEKSEKINLAIDELKENSKSKSIDILLLQEMDENGVIQIAESFNLNYIYFPFSKNRKSNKNFGNAILSRYEIKNAEKLMLPHVAKNNRLRAATKCEIKIHDKTYLIYSIHQSTITMKKSKRIDQLDAVMTDIKQEYKNYDQIIVGGDFNTLFKKDLNRTINAFKNAGFENATEDIGHTSAALFKIIKPINDHIFIKTGKLIDKGKIEHSKSSDHLPIYIELSK